MSEQLQHLNRDLATRDPQRNLSLRDRLQQRKQGQDRNILLLDTSGSMGEHIEGNQRRIDVLWSTVQDLRAQGVRFRTCIFNTHASWQDVEAVPEVTGSTNIAGALEFVSEIRPGRITLVSDGEPDSAPLALDAAKRLGCPINCLYIGPNDNPQAKAFLQDLATVSGGSYASERLDTAQFQLQAVAQVRGMLTAGSLTPQQPIAL